MEKLAPDAVRKTKAIPMKMVHPFFVEFDKSTRAMSNTRSQDLAGRMQPVVSAISLAWREKLVLGDNTITIKINGSKFRGDAIVSRSLGRTLQL